LPLLNLDTQTTAAAASVIYFKNRTATCSEKDFFGSFVRCSNQLSVSVCVCVQTKKANEQVISSPIIPTFYGQWKTRTTHCTINISREEKKNVRYTKSKPKEKEQTNKKTSSFTNAKFTNTLKAKQPKMKKKCGFRN